MKWKDFTKLLARKSDILHGLGECFVTMITAVFYVQYGWLSHAFCVLIFNILENIVLESYEFIKKMHILKKIF